MAIANLKQRFGALGLKAPEKLKLLASDDLYKTGYPLAIDDVNEQSAIEDVLRYLEDQKKGLCDYTDNLSTFRREQNENDNSEAQNPLIGWLVFIHMGYSVPAVHHSAKAGNKEEPIIEAMDYVLVTDPNDQPWGGKKKRILPNRLNI